MLSGWMLTIPPKPESGPARFPHLAEHGSPLIIGQDELVQAGGRSSEEHVMKLIAEQVGYVVDGEIDFFM